MGNLFSSSASASVSVSQEELAKPLLPPEKKQELADAFRWSEKPEQTKVEAALPRFDDKVIDRKAERIKREANESIIEYTISSEDSLQSLSLRFDVSTDRIRRLNQMTDDRLTSFTVLLIPVARGKEKVPETPQQGEETITDEQRDKLVGLMTRIDPQLVTCEQGATYYLELHGYDLKKALREAEKDAKWESRQRRSNQAS